MPVAPRLKGLIPEEGDFEAWLREDTLRHLKASEHLERELLECARLQAERFFLDEQLTPLACPASETISLPAASA